MVATIPIRCPSCHNVVIKDENSLRYYALTEDIKCEKCKAIVIKHPKVTY